MDHVVTLLVVRRRFEIASALRIRKGPSKNAAEEAWKEDCSWGGVHGFCTGIEGMIPLSISW